MDTLVQDSPRDSMDGLSRDDMDVYEQLAEKERDLILAAELGKALLEKNQELSRQNEQLLEDYGRQLEDAHQQKYDLHLLMETRESEYENRIKELETDNSLLREELDERETTFHNSEKDKKHVIQELTRQNERLNDQLHKAAQQEQSYLTQLKALRDQVHLRKSTMHDHVNQMEVLGKEIHNLTERKTQLERRVASVSKERDTALEQLEHLHEHRSVMERDYKEKQLQLQNQETEIRRLEEDNKRLQANIETLTLQSRDSNYGSCILDARKSRGDSLFEELQYIETMSASTPKHNAFHEDDVDCSNIEEDEESIPSIPIGANSFNAIARDYDVDVMETNETQEDGDLRLRRETITAYNNLIEMCHNLRGNGADLKSRYLDENQENISTCLLEVIADLSDLIQDMLNKQSKHNDNASQEVSNLQSELTEAREQLDKLRDEITSKDRQLNRSMQDFTVLKEQHRQNKEELITKDRSLQQTRNERDEAMQIKNSLAQELAQTKQDMTTLNRQLLQAVEQKMALSEQLEKWQEDMHDVIASNVNEQIKRQHGHRRHASDHSIHRKVQDEAKGSPQEEKKWRFAFW